MPARIDHFIRKQAAAAWRFHVTPFVEVCVVGPGMIDRDNY